MKYSSSTALQQQRRAQKMRLLLAMGALLVGVALIGGLVWGCVALFSHDGGGEDPVEYLDEVEVGGALLERDRLLREEIPAVNFAAVPYVRMFDDSNDVQLATAMAVGLKNPETVGDLDRCNELVRIKSTRLYVVDSMTHSKPYLVPEAALMLWYIGERFKEILDETEKDSCGYRFIVTSALRSNEDVNRLKRWNPNASENSCHRFGTTIDISYANFMRADGELAQEEWLKAALGKALYELRYEGLCWVKYEVRQPCFHITMRSTNYEGTGAKATKSYPDFRYRMLEKRVARRPKVF